MITSKEFTGSKSQEKTVFQSSPTSGVIIIGNEILSGRTQDINVRYIANTLNNRGIYLKETRIIIDDIITISKTIQDMRVNYDLIITTGGIGSTHDDVTVEAIAHALQRPLTLNQSAVKALNKQYGEENVTPAHLKMAYLPEGSFFIENSQFPFIGGFYLENIYVLAGVPLVMQKMLDCIESILPSGPEIKSKTVVGFLSEASIAVDLSNIQKAFTNVSIGSYPFRNQEDNQDRVEIVIRGTNEVEIQRVYQEIHKLICRA